MTGINQSASRGVRGDGIAEKSHEKQSQKSPQKSPKLVSRHAAVHLLHLLELELELVELLLLPEDLLTHQILLLLLLLQLLLQHYLGVLLLTHLLLSHLLLSHLRLLPGAPRKKHNRPNGHGVGSCTDRKASADHPPHVRHTTTV